jgi:murein DD-endopeptidase MepM/ murein hydrolase activator NlpD
MKSLELYAPLEHYIVSQRFGANPNINGYQSGGHPGMDLVTTYGDTIRFAAEGPVYKTINFGNPDLMAYRAVMQIVELDDSLDCYEITYGHCDTLLCRHGLFQIGSLVATEGNTGEVYSGGRLVTLAEKQAGSKAGFHLHFQLRYCRKVTTYDPTQHYLSSEADQTSPYDDGRYYYSIPHYDNGANGCIDPMPFMVSRSAREAGQIITALKADLAFATSEVEKLKAASA